MDKAKVEQMSLAEKNRRRTRLVALDGMLAALGVLLMLVMRIPLFPAAPYLTYEMGDVPAILAGLLLGPVHGLAVLAVICLVQLAVMPETLIWGLIMHLAASGVLVLVPALFWKWKKTIPSLLIGLVLGGLGMTLLMVPLNLLITPIYTHAPVEAIKPLILPIIVPFNLIKSSLNGLASFLVFLAVHKIFVKNKN